eukprot:334675_1
MQSEDLKRILHPCALFIGLLPAVLGMGTIFYCYYTTIYVEHHLPDWLWMPVISLLGCAEPESTIYQIGFGLTGLSTLLFFFTFQTSILAYIPVQQFPDEVNKLKWTVLVAAFGVFGQGVITMEADALQSFAETDPEEDKIDWKPGTQSIIHQLLAAVFFVACMFHGWSAITVYNNCETGPIPSLVIVQTAAVDSPYYRCIHRSSRQRCVRACVCWNKCVHCNPDALRCITFILF